MKKIKNLPGLIAAAGAGAGAAVGVMKYMNSKVSEPEKTGSVFGLICPMEEELTPFKEAMDITNKERHAGASFYEGTLDGQNVVIAQCGVGKVNAAVCAEAMIAFFDVDYLLNIGVAGTTKDGVKQGDIVIGNEAVQHDMDVTARGFQPGEVPDMFITNFIADDNLIDLAKEAASQCELDGASVHTGRIASGDQFIAGGEASDKIKDVFDPYAVEMEGAAVAQAAWINNVPFVIIRAISDNADKDAPVKTYDEFLPTAIVHSTEIVRKMLELAGERESF